MFIWGLAVLMILHLINSELFRAVNCKLCKIWWASCELMSCPSVICLSLNSSVELFVFDSRLLYCLLSWHMLSWTGFSPGCWNSSHMLLASELSLFPLIVGLNWIPNLVGLTMLSIALRYLKMLYVLSWAFITTLSPLKYWSKSYSSVADDSWDCRFRLRVFCSSFCSWSSMLMNIFRELRSTELLVLFLATIVVGFGRSFSASPMYWLLFFRRFYYWTLPLASSSLFKLYIDESLAPSVVFTLKSGWLTFAKMFFELAQWYWKNSFWHLL